MTARYQAGQVREASQPNAFMRNYVDGAATGVQVAGAIQQGGDEIRKYAMVQQRRNDEWDAARVMEAQTEYNRVMSDRMDNPENGVTNTRKLGSARGVTDEIDKFGDETATKIADTLDNDGQRQAFLRVAQRAKIPYWKQASDFEAGQVKGYRDQVFKTTLEQGGMAVQRAPLDNVAFATATEQGANAIRAQYYGADEAVVNAAVSEYTSGLENQRIAIIAAEDPILANQMIEDSPHLTPETRSKLKSAVAPQVELLQTQEYVDQLVTQFGPDKAQEGIAHIRATNDGKDEEKRVTAYKARINEMKVREGNADADLRKAQNQNFEAYKTKYYQDGAIPPQSQLDTDLNNKYINADQYRTMTTWGEVAATRADITKSLAKNDPNWNNMTAEEQDSKVMRVGGTTPTQRAETLKTIQGGVLDGTVTDADIDAAYNNMRISRAERDYYKALDVKIEKEQKNFIAQQRRNLTADIAAIDIPGKNGARYRGIAQSVFTEKVDQIESQSKTYRQDVMDARREAIVAAVEDSGKDLERGAWFGWGPMEKTKLGQRVAGALTSLEEATGSIQEYRPEAFESKIDLAPRPEEGPAYKKNAPRTHAVQNVAQQMVSGGTLTGRFSDYRSYRKGQHNGIDIAAPEGTPITSPDLGVPLTVSTVRTGSKTAGNFVVLAGQLPNGDKIEMQVSHMQNGSIPVKQGDTVNPGDIIGAVGNTGYTSDRSKGGKVTPWYKGKSSGHHADVKIKVNGKYVDPENPRPGPTLEAAAAINAKPALDDVLFGGKEGI